MFSLFQTCEHCTPPCRTKRSSRCKLQRTFICYGLFITLLLPKIHPMNTGLGDVPLVKAFVMIVYKLGKIMFCWTQVFSITYMFFLQEFSLCVLQHDGLNTCFTCGSVCHGCDLIVPRNTLRAFVQLLSRLAHSVVVIIVF